MQFASEEPELDARTAYTAARTAAHHVRPLLGDARKALEGELVITPDMEDGLAAVMRATRALYGLEAVGEAGACSEIDEAMDALNRALKLVQGEISQHETVARAGELIARSLAMLYPAREALAQAMARESAKIAGLWAETPHELEEAIPLSAPRRKRRPVEMVPTTTEDAERRFTRRMQLDVDIGWSSETNFFVGFAEDIGDGGIFVSTYDLLPTGTAVNISLVLPSGHHVNTRGRVAWIRTPKSLDDEMTPGFGVQFEDLSDADRKALEAYCARRQPIFFDV